ncbi:MAG: ABC-F family ATP-binding cassette domain-containing protein [Alphaproteobacteria bacterium]|nr:ABC-F family ATP-binding cassette domain-containing protein [Alphaproteobacteria bacterium]
MLILNSITARLGGQTILEEATATLPARSRVGIVGRNGAGKSTLLKIIAGEMQADGGAVETPRNTRIGYVAQEAPGGTTTPFEMVLAADEERVELLGSAERATDATEISDAHERLNMIDAHGAPARAARILAGLGFDEEGQHEPLSSFSGGWRMRVALAGLLFSRPDLLLLDEPSNHLDLEAALWLESFLRTYPAAMVIVSHERDLLNNVADHILHVQGGKITLYPGGYDAFERQRSERLSQVESMRTRQEEKRAKLQAYVDRWRYKAHTAKQAQSRMKALARMEPVAAATEDPSLRFDFPNPNELRPPLIVADDAAVGYVAGTPVLSKLNFRIDPDDRIAFLGRNGNGKTTLARLLAGQLPTMAGGMTSSGKLKVGYFAQHQVEELVADDTPLDHMSRLLKGSKPGDVRSQLGRFGFSGEKVHLEVKKLSGGERARLALALITREAPHILILDEPTNHLDVDAREALVQALNAYEGAVVMVSHDRHLLEMTADRLVLVADGSAGEFAGSLDDYRDLLLGRGAKKSNNVVEQKKSKSGNRKDERRAAAQERDRTKHLRSAAHDAEKGMALLTEERTEIDRAMFDPDGGSETYQGQSMSELMKSRGEVEKKLERAEAVWIEASEALEGVSAD